MSASAACWLEYAFVCSAHAFASFWAVSEFVSVTVKSIASKFGSGTIVVSFRSCEPVMPLRPLLATT